MTLNERISLIDSLIKENPDTTIKDYLETLSEITGISQAMFLIPKKKEVELVLKEEKHRKVFQAKYVTPAKIHL